MMDHTLFRVRLPDGRVRLAVGAAHAAPTHLLPADVTLTSLLRRSADGFASALASVRDDEPVPEGYALLAPIEDQEVWAAGVTYGWSRQARVDESERDGDVYERVWTAARPELFFKSVGARVRGPGATIGIREDSSWDVPEPELALVLTSELEIAGFTIGNDVSSRSIEAENPLYLPQAKLFDGACSLGPAIVPACMAQAPFTIVLRIHRGDALVVSMSTSTSEMRRSFDELVAYLGRAMRFPDGAVLLTGTSLVPGDDYTLLPGDEVEIEIGGLGVLRNVAAPAPLS